MKPNNRTRGGGLSLLICVTSIFMCSSCCRILPIRVDLQEGFGGTIPAKVEWPDLVLDLSHSRVCTFSERLVVRREGDARLFICGRYVGPSADRYPKIRRISLSDVGFQERDLARLRVYWQDPDGRQTLLWRAINDRYDAQEVAPGQAGGM